MERRAKGLFQYFPCDEDCLLFAEKDHRKKKWALMVCDCKAPKRTGRTETVTLSPLMITQDVPENKSVLVPFGTSSAERPYFFRL